MGDLGPGQGQALVYDWKWYYAARGLFVWAILALAMAIPKANRDRRAALILVPVAAVSLVWVLAQAVLHLPSAQAYYLDVVVSSLVVGIAVLWLLASSLGRLRGVARFFLALCLMFAVAVVGGLSTLSASSSGEVVVLPIVMAFFAAILLSAMAATARQCRGGYSPARLLLRLGLWMTLGTLVVVYGCFLAVALSSGELIPDVMVFAGVGLAGLVSGLLLYLLSLPYMVLGLASPFFRARMQACLGVPPNREQSSDSSPPPL
jgi:hypothetical protein